MTFLELSKKILEEVKIPLSGDEIWDYAKLKGYDKNLNSKGKTPWATIIAQLYVNIRDKKDSPFAITPTRPKKFYLKQIGIIENKKIETVIKKEVKSNYNEGNLHPILVYWVNTYLNIYCKTINHNKTSNKVYSQWQHPDIVGTKFGDWSNSSKSLAQNLGVSTIELFSFELKKSLDLSNLRECFFQAVSNSSWANEGYLVCAELDRKDEFVKELKRLNSSFGIGVIHLNISNPDDSEIVFNALHKTEIDWEFVSDLSEKNPDYEKFLKRIKSDMNSEDIAIGEYDKVLKVEDISINN